MTRSLRETAQSGGVLWITGLPSSGKTTLGQALCESLRACGEKPVLLDGDELRAGLSADLGFSAQDRQRQAARVAYVASCVEKAGGWAVVCLISPYHESRSQARQTTQRFCLIHVATSLTVCEQRDTKGLYARARRGEINDFTGISAPYEAPQNAEITVGCDEKPVSDDSATVLDYLRERDWLEA